MATLPCEDGGGSLNNPNNEVTPVVEPFVPAQPCVGQWELSSTNPDICQQTDQQRQESYVAESLNISGAPVNIYKLLGIHEQGNGSLLADASVFASTAFPGYPSSGINSNSLPWRSIQTGASIPGNTFVGVDFGIKMLAVGGSEYKPDKPNWKKVAALQITQSSIPNYWARQVRAEIADGTCEVGSVMFSGSGNGVLSIDSTGSNATQSVVSVVANTANTFIVFATMPSGAVISLGLATVGVLFSSTFVNFTINAGTVPFAGGDMFTFSLNYVWKRVGIYNLVQSPLPQTINFQTPLSVKAVRLVPTMFTGTENWEVLALDVLDSAPTDINNIQDLFFNENRDRDYAKVPLMLKVQYNPTDSVSDLAKFGINILDQYTFTASFNMMVQTLGRPVVVGDILEVIPEMQYDHNMRPIRKFLEVTDTGWASEGFGAHWKPTLYRFQAQQALPSQETRDIFGTLDTQKYLIPDSILADGIGEQLDVTPLTQTEEVQKEAAHRVPETGSDDQRSTIGSPLPAKQVAPNAKGQPEALDPVPLPGGAQNIYIEDGLPPNGEAYGEGFKLPEMNTATDGDYFRLYYPPETKIPPRLYRFSSVKNRWIYMETDRRGLYSSHKPSVRNILQSDTKQGLGKKTT